MWRTSERLPVLRLIRLAVFTDEAVSSMGRHCWRLEVDSPAELRVH